MRLVGTAIFLVLTGVGTSARAQDLPSVETTTIDLSPYIQPGKALRISGTALRRVGGYVVGVRSDTILVGTVRGSSTDAARPIRLGAVDTLWTRGTWFGPSLLVGISLGLGIGGAACVFHTEGTCKVFPIATAAGIIGGAVIGATRKVWRKRFVRRDGGPQPMIGPWMER